MEEINLNDFSCKLINNFNTIIGFGSDYIECFELGQPKHSILDFNLKETITRELFNSCGFFIITYKGSNLLSIDISKNKESTCDILNLNIKCLKLDITTLSGNIFFLFKNNKESEGINKILFYTNTLEFAKVLAEKSSNPMKQKETVSSLLPYSKQ
jgi:hypothetical protein